MTYRKHMFYNKNKHKYIQYKIDTLVRKQSEELSDKLDSLEVLDKKR